jgi:hypothetical protein
MAKLKTYRVDGYMTINITATVQAKSKPSPSERRARRQSHFSQCDCQIYEECVDMGAGI